MDKDMFLVSVRILERWRFCVWLGGEEANSDSLTWYFNESGFVNDTRGSASFLLNLHNSRGKAQMYIPPAHFLVT